MKKTNLDNKTVRDFKMSECVEEFTLPGNIRGLIIAHFGFCAYIGIPKDHPFAGKIYDDIPLNVHGGLTYGNFGNADRDKDYYWYGWDYAHYGDAIRYAEKGKEIPELEAINMYKITGEKEWTVKEVRQELLAAIPEFKKLMKIAEK